jgi:hypothetical protein
MQKPTAVLCRIRSGAKECDFVDEPLANVSQTLQLLDAEAWYSQAESCYSKKFQQMCLIHEVTYELQDSIESGKS